MAVNVDLEEKVKVFQEKFQTIGTNNIEPRVLKTGVIEIYPVSEKEPLLQLQLKADPYVKIWLPATGAVTVLIDGTNYNVFREPYPFKH